MNERKKYRKEKENNMHKSNNIYVCIHNNASPRGELTHMTSLVREFDLPSRINSPCAVMSSFSFEFNSPTF